WPGGAGLDHLALTVVGLALLAPTHHEAVALAAVHHERDGLGGFAKRNRQAARGERIERAGVPGALGWKQAFHRRRRLPRGHADRLVEHDPAMDVALVAARLIVGPPLLACARIVVASRVAATFFRKTIVPGVVRVGALRADHALGG